jgi:hypothetical protein
MALITVYTGSSGTLTLADQDTPEGRESKAIQDAYELQTVGRVTDVRVNVQTELTEFHEVGRRHAASLHPGNVHVFGSVGRAYVNGAFVFLLLGRGASATQVAEPYALPVFNLTVTLADPAVPGNALTLELGGVRFQNWSYGLPEDDFVMENLTFKALTISVVDKEAPAGGGDATPKTPAFPG